MLVPKAALGTERDGGEGGGGGKREKSEPRRWRAKLKVLSKQRLAGIMTSKIPVICLHFPHTVVLL